VLEARVGIGPFKRRNRAKITQFHWLDKHTLAYKHHHFAYTFADDLLTVREAILCGKLLGLSSRSPTMSQ
jgi:hypothetical protein